MPPTDKKAEKADTLDAVRRWCWMHPGRPALVRLPEGPFVVTYYPREREALESLND